jgi:long-subunit acyl-CoA synthetase (AMP-forming)
MYRVSRVDNVLVLSTGQTVVPAPLEDVINTHPSVACCCVFGHKHDRIGIIIQPKNIVDVSSQHEVNKFIDKIRQVLYFPPMLQSF